MKIIPPETIQKQLFEGPFVLQLDETDLFTKGKEESSRLSKKELRMLDTPSVTIGYPGCKPLKEYIKETGGMLSALPGSVDSRDTFFLIQCACSFRPSQKKGSRIKSARFKVTLRAQHGHRHPIALDIYPRKIEVETSSNFQINITPLLKIIAVEFESGEMGATVNANKLISIITGSGVRESEVSWHFKEHNNEGIEGANFLYMIVNRPREAKAIEISMDVVAKVRTVHGIFLARIEGLRNQLVETICGDR